MTDPESLVSAEAMPSVVPVLSVVVPDAEIPQAVKTALDEKEFERAEFMALADELVRELRPEMERLTTELVQHSLRRAWVHRSKINLG